MRKPRSIRPFLLLGFFSFSYVAISAMSPGILAPFMVKQCKSITVGATMSCHEDRFESLTLKDVE